MKRFLAIILAGLMLLSLAACGGKDDNVVKGGFLEEGGVDRLVTSEHQAHANEGMGLSNNKTVDRIKYNNLSSALMDLESGKIDFMGVEKSTADYIAAHNDKISVTVKNDRKTNFAMMTLDSKTEIYNILNDAIKAMKADGTLDSLIENELNAYINSDPVAKDLPRFDGAITIKVGVTGDVPPMDFVASNGKAAGFNIALLAEIANRVQVNFELVQIEAGARPMALSSGKVDVVFWTKNVVCTKCGSEGAEQIDGTIVTETYYSDLVAHIQLKSDK